MRAQLTGLSQLAAAVLAVLTLVLGGGAAQAQGLTETYCTTISENDKSASDGYPLKDAASILRQDRANYHKFGTSDAGDDADSTFDSAKARERLPAMFERGSTPSDVAEEILYGAPYVCVDIYGNRHIDVYLASGAAPVGDMGDESGPVALPFEGTWDCEVATFTFTSGTYDNGSEVLEMQDVQEGTDGSYTLFFDGDYMITLSGFTGDSMGWYSSASGDSFNCSRIYY